MGSRSGIFIFPKNLFELIWDIPLENFTSKVTFYFFLFAFTSVRQVSKLAASSHKGLVHILLGQFI